MMPVRELPKAAELKPAHSPAVYSPDLNFYPCSYTWHDPHFGELAGHTVIIGADADAALKHFRSLHPNLTSAVIPEATS